MATGNVTVQNSGSPYALVLDVDGTLVPMQPDELRLLLRRLQAGGRELFWRYNDADGVRLNNPVCALDVTVGPANTMFRMPASVLVIDETAVLKLMTTLRSAIGGNA